MTTVRKDDLQSNYVCGNCRQRIDFPSREEPPVPCPECGYEHRDLRITDVPSKIKLDLTQY